MTERKIDVADRVARIRALARELGAAAQEGRLGELLREVEALAAELDATSRAADARRPAQNID